MSLQSIKTLDPSVFRGLLHHLLFPPHAPKIQIIFKIYKGKICQIRYSIILQTFKSGMLCKLWNCISSSKLATVRKGWTNSRSSISYQLGKRVNWRKQNFKVIYKCNISAWQHWNSKNVVPKPFIKENGFVLIMFCAFILNKFSV